MAAGGSINQLRDDAHLIGGFLHTAFQYVAHAQFLPNVLYVCRFAFVGERRIARDDKQAGDAGKITGEDFSDTVAEIILLRVFTHVVKRQHDDGGLIRQR